MIRGALAAMMCSAVLVQSPQQPRDPRPRPSAAAGASISGTAISVEQQPRKLRRVLVSISSGSLDTIARTVITDDEGRFRFEALPAGQYGLTAVKEGFIPIRYGSSRAPRLSSARVVGKTGLAVAPGETVTVDIRMVRGAVITGVVIDPDGRPAEGVLVAASSYQFVPTSGERRLLVSGAGLVTTDDLGVYRIFGLPAGEYVVFARPRFVTPNQTVPLSSSDARPVSPASVYSPSTTDATEAERIKLKPGEERGGVDIQLQQVPTATVSGTVAGPPGSIGSVLVLTRATGVPGVLDIVMNGRADPAGAFSLARVPPGRYTLYATTPAPSPASEAWAVGSSDILVAGDDVTNLTIGTAPGFAISGRIVLDGASASELSLGSMSLPLAPIGYVGVRPHFQPLSGGRFAISGVVAAQYRIASSTAGIRTPLGKWWLRSIVIDGHEALDAPLDLRQSSDDALISLSDRASIVSGVARDPQGSPLGDAYVVVFGAEPSFWFPSSRRVAGVRTDAQGRYTIRNLPPGEYRAAIALDLEPGEWFDPDLLQNLLPVAATVTISGTEAKTVDLVLR